MAFSESTSSKRLFEWGVQFIKFGAVGALNTIISLICYYLFIWISPKLYLPGQVVGFLVSVLNAYYWNNRYVFRSGRKWSWKDLFHSYVAYGGTALLSALLSILEIEVLHWSAWIVPIINLCITVPVNFLTHKFWVYRKKEPEADGGNQV